MKIVGVTGLGGYIHFS